MGNIIYRPGTVFLETTRIVTLLILSNSMASCESDKTNKACTALQLRVKIDNRTLETDANNFAEIESWRGIGSASQELREKKILQAYSDAYKQLGPPEQSIGNSKCILDFVDGIFSELDKYSVANQSFYNRVEHQLLPFLVHDLEESAASGKFDFSTDYGKNIRIRLEKHKYPPALPVSKWTKLWRQVCKGNWQYIFRRIRTDFLQTDIQ